VAVLPLAALVLAALWQAVIAGHAAWAATAAARTAARAAAVGGDAGAAARARLGDGLGASARVDADGRGRVRVSVRIPPLVRGWDLGRVDGEGSFRPQVTP
jgi:hypothetical protein